MYRDLFLPAAILSSTIVGGGMFALPYVVEKAGLVLSLFYILIFGGVFCLMHLLYADIIVRTKEKHRFAGYAENYLGGGAKWLAVLTTIIGMLFTLTAEFLLAASFATLLFPTSAELIKIIFVWALGSLAVFLTINELAISEFLMSGAMAAIVIFLLADGLPNFSLPPAHSLSLAAFLLPYGALLFALDGRPAIPSVVRYFKDERQSRGPILLGTLLPVILYGLFVVAVLGITPSPTPDSFSGMLNVLPFWLLALVALLGFIAVFSTYIVIGRDIRKSLVYDLKFPSFLAGAIVVAGPLLIYLGGFNQFLKLIGLVGGVFIGLEGILILLMWRRVSKTSSKDFLIPYCPFSIVYLLLLVFAGGIVYEIVKLIGN